MFGTRNCRALTAVRDFINVLPLSQRVSWAGDRHPCAKERRRSELIRSAISSSHEISWGLASVRCLR